MSDQNSKEPSNKCNCSDPACCQPKPAAPWKKIAFFIVILAAVAIVGYKLLSKPTTTACDPSSGCCSKDSTEKCIK